MAHRPTAGKVFLVGAGPGDPALLTLRGATCLSRADVVLYDYLVNPRVLDHLPPTAERIVLGGHALGRRWTQSEINNKLVELAIQGKQVVRLKGGDPAIFAHLDEELDALESHQIPYEVVPGITAALSAASHGGIPLTQRDDASAVALITGHESADKGTAIDWLQLAKFPGTLVIYMGVTSVDSWSQGLLSGGLPHDTPVALVRRCSWPDQRIIHTSLGDVATELTPRSKLPPPVIAIVGAVAARGLARDWFARRPLSGLRILVTRPAHQQDQMESRLTELGASVISCPAIVIGPPNDWSPVDHAISRLAEFDWIVFSSSNGVRYFLDRVWHRGLDMRHLGACKIATMGPGTTSELGRYQLRSDCQPSEFRAEELADALCPMVTNKRCLLIRASRGREVLAERLTQAGASVEQVVTYSSSDAIENREAFQSLIESRQIDWVTVTSSAIAKSLVAGFGDVLKSVKLVSISPITSQTLRELGYEPAVEAEEYSMDGIVNSLITYHR